MSMKMLRLYFTSSELVATSETYLLQIPFLAKDVPVRDLGYSGWRLTVTKKTSVSSAKVVFSNRRNFFSFVLPKTFKYTTLENLLSELEKISCKRFVLNKEITECTDKELLEELERRNPIKRKPKPTTKQHNVLSLTDLKQRLEQ